MDAAVRFEREIITKDDRTPLHAGFLFGGMLPWIANTESNEGGNSRPLVY
jgi:hypothetical protein